MNELGQNAVNKINNAYQFLRELDLFHRKHLQSTTQSTENKQREFVPYYNTQYPQFSPGFTDPFFIYPVVTSTNFIPPTASNIPGSQEPSFPEVIPVDTAEPAIPVFPDVVVPATETPVMRPTQRNIPPYIPPRPDPSFPVDGEDNNPENRGSRGIATEQDDMNQEPERENGFDGEETDINAGNPVNKDVDILYNYY